MHVGHALFSLPARSTRPIPLLRPLSADYTHDPWLRVLLVVREHHKGGTRSRGINEPFHCLGFAVDESQQC